MAPTGAPRIADRPAAPRCAGRMADGPRVARMAGVRHMARGAEPRTGRRGMEATIIRPHTADGDTVLRRIMPRRPARQSPAQPWGSQQVRPLVLRPQHHITIRRHRRHITGPPSWYTPDGTCALARTGVGA